MYDKKTFTACNLCCAKWCQLPPRPPVVRTTSRGRGKLSERAVHHDICCWCAGCDDCCCVLWCGPCALDQLARQEYLASNGYSVEYDFYAATGVVPGVHYARPPV